MSDDLEKCVHASLDYALENGYDVRSWKVDDVICDLQCFAQDCEDMLADQLRPHVESWQVKQRSKLQ